VAGYTELEERESNTLRSTYGIFLHCRMGLPGFEPGSSCPKPERIIPAGNPGNVECPEPSYPTAPLQVMCSNMVFKSFLIWGGAKVRVVRNSW